MMIKIQINDGNGWRTDKTPSSLVNAYREASQAVKEISHYWGLSRAKAEKCVQVIDKDGVIL
jgi:hypothetical protein